MAIQLISRRRRKRQGSGYCRDGGDANKGHKKKMWYARICSQCGHHIKSAYHEYPKCPKCGAKPKAAGAGN